MPAWSDRVTTDVWKLMLSGSGGNMSPIVLIPRAVRNGSTSVWTWPDQRNEPRSSGTPRSKTRPWVAMASAASLDSGVIAFNAPIWSPGPQIHPQPWPRRQPAPLFASITDPRLFRWAERTRAERSRTTIVHWP